MPKTCSPPVHILGQEHQEIPQRCPTKNQSLGPKGSQEDPINKFGGVK